MRSETEKRQHQEAELRLFFAFEIPSEIREKIGREREVLIRDFPKSRWVRKEGQHLTVAFLGDTPTPKIDEIVGAVSGSVAGSGKAEFSLRGAGFFPNEKHPRNAWIGGRSAVGAEVAARVGEVLRSLGLNCPDREWNLHLTQARFPRPWPPSVVRRFVDWVEDLGPIEFSRDQLTLFASSLQPGGARYRSLAKVSLR